jgi:hypothetical protein
MLYRLKDKKGIGRLTSPYRFKNYGLGSNGILPSTLSCLVWTLLMVMWRHP